MPSKPANHGKEYSRADLNAIKRMAQAGQPTADIAKALKRTEDAVRSAAHRNDISLKPFDKARR